MTFPVRRLLMLSLAIVPVVTEVAAAQLIAAPGVAELTRLDTLPRYKEGVSVASFSSYDRTGGNDDGFSGAHSFLRKEGDRLVIAEMRGPGAIYRIWTPTPTDDLVEFFFDGEETPRLSVKFRDLFSGKQFPFLQPVVGLGAGGFYSYLPLPYHESCKVTIKAKKIQFYQINYATFADGANVKTFDAKAGDEFKADLEKAQQLIRATGTDVSDRVVPAEAKLESHAFAKTVEAGKAVTLFESDTPGRVAALKIGPANAFAGAGRDVLLNVYYDGGSTPSFSVPAADFFGFSFGEPAMRSLLLGTADGACYSYLPMPFEKSIRIELASDNPQGRNIAVCGEVKTADLPRAASEGEFFALWRRENPTTPEKPFTFIEAQGKGHLVGFTLQAQGTDPGGIPEFFEGDDQTTIDGQTVINGTGSEDFFNGGWYDLPGMWDDRTLLPLSGCLDYKRYLGRTGAYRFLFTDAYPFTQSIKQTIEHGPEKNNRPGDYVGMTYLYADHAPATQPIASQAERAVSNPKRVVFSPGLSMPVYAFSRSGATIGKPDEKFGDMGLQFFSLKASVKDLKGASQFVTFVADLPQTGTYRVTIESIKGPEGPIVQLVENELPLGDRVDLYDAKRTPGKATVVGEVKLKAGENRLQFRIVDKNAAAAGYKFDVCRIICERLD